MEESINIAIEEYQCSGCVNGCDIECFESDKGHIGCGKHTAGTTIMGQGKIFLGLPRAFARMGCENDMKIQIFKTMENGWEYDMFNIPVWKYLDKYGNTLVRGFMPRINKGFVHVFIGDFISEIKCLELTDKDIEEMD